MKNTTFKKFTSLILVVLLLGATAFVSHFLIGLDMIFIME